MKKAVILSVLSIFAMVSGAISEETRVFAKVSIDKPLKDLDSKDEKIREAAIKILMKDAGKEVNGVRMGVFAEKLIYKKGESVTVITILQNNSDKDLKVQTGYSTSGNYLLCGSALRYMVNGKETRMKYSGRGVCGTGAQPLFDTIKAKSVKIFKTIINTENEEFKIAKGHAGYKMPLNNKHTFHFSLQRKEDARVKTNWSGKPSEPFNKKDYWHGKMISNELVLNFN